VIRQTGGQGSVLGCSNYGTQDTRCGDTEEAKPGGNLRVNEQSRCDWSQRKNRAFPTSPNPTE